jgi:CHAT domain-containing protein
VKAIAALLLLAAACNHEDTGASGVWRRTVEPRLTTTSSWHSCTSKLSPGHVVAVAQCDAAPNLGGPCDDVVNSRDEADGLLVAKPQCTDAAIAALENFSRADAAAMSDLAGAYFVRAQRNDNPADLLRAFDAARHAVAARPQPHGAPFNQALILEALSLDADAIEAWQRAAAAEEGEWAEEARRHRKDLVRRRSLDGEQQWAEVRARIDAALDAGNVGETRRLIAMFPATAEKHFEEKVLRQWAAAPSPLQTARVATFAEALSQSFKDRYFIDVAATIVNARSPAVIDRLRKGHLHFAEARDSENAIDYQAAAGLYDRAARLLQEGGSPQFLLARVAYAVQNAVATSDNEAALRQLDAVAADARRRQYPSVVARVESNRIYPHQFADHYNELFAAYDAAVKAYGAIGDWEDRVAADARTVAAMSVLGLKETAWRTSLAAMRDVPRLLSGRTRHLLIGPTADAALALGHPEAALLYQNVVLENARRQRSNVYLVSALVHLAAIELRLQRYDDAQVHIDAADRLNQKQSTNLRDALAARLAEVQGETALHVDPSRAIAPLTRAIGLASPEYATYRAMLYAERAEAFHRLGRRAEEEADRLAALRELHAEQEGMLKTRQPGHADDLWNSYFSRFQETYDLLIRQLIDEGDADGAFRYAERARAFEPLDLVRKLPAAPAAFLELSAHPDDLDIAKLRQQLPPGTFLIEYRVFDDQTYAWIVGRDVFAGQWLKARSSDVKRWTAALQRAASRRDSAAFEGGLQPPYEGLLKAPLDLIHRRPGGNAANVVIVPDRELRGLPFAALRNPDTKRYVIEDHAVSMSGSALLYVFAVLRDRDLASRDASALLIGDPAFDPQSTLAQGLPRLPRARWEVGTIGSFYRPSAILMDDAATPQEFLRLVGGNAIVHIAAHGVVNGEAPSQSFLLLHGLLNAEMLVKDLHTDKTRLVVLGACSSAGGLPVGAEGIAPLVRPLVGAGVPGVVGALWDIDDATAARLLVSFHRHYREGSDAAVALRQAQLDLLRSDVPAERAARIWAPYQAIGYASSPFASIGDMKKEKPP